MSKRGLGTMIRKFRGAKRMKQGELARRVGIGQGYLAQLESGIKKNPSLEVLKKLARALRVSVTRLVK